MGAYEVRDVLMLRPGDRIVVQLGRVETVRKPSKRKDQRGVVIFTEEHDILTTLPATAKVLGGR
jgi:hypothetical protein